MTDIENLPPLEEIATTARQIELAVAVYFLFDRGVPENRLRCLWSRSNELTVRQVHEDAPDRRDGALCNDLKTV